MKTTGVRPVALTRSMSSRVCCGMSDIVEFPLDLGASRINLRTRTPSSIPSFDLHLVSAGLLDRSAPRFTGTAKGAHSPERDPPRRIPFVVNERGATHMKRETGLR